MVLPLLAFGLVLAACFVAPRLPWLMAWDQSAIAAVAGWRSEDLTRFFRILTDIGDTRGFLVFFLVPVLLHLWRRHYQTALIYLVGVGLLKLSAALVKLAILRPRPLDGLLTLTTWSMPSGHAGNAVFMFGVLAVVCWKKISSPFLKIPALLFCFAVVLLIGFSRVYLGVHYPSDVVLGWLYAATGLWVLYSLRRDIFDFA